MRIHLDDYGDIIFDKAYNNSFHQCLESLQYKASMAITGSSTERLYYGLGLQSLENKQCSKNFVYFRKLWKNSSQNIYLT